MNFKLITPQRFPNEKNDCVVLAVSEVESIPYHEAYDKVFLSAHRGFRKGAYIKTYVKDKAYTNCMPQSGNYKLTLREVVWTHREGRFIVCNCSHAMALIDGTIHDLSEPKWRSEIQEIWKYEHSI